MARIRTEAMSTQPQPARATPQPSQPQEAKVVPAPPKNGPLMKEIQDQLDAIFELLNDETQEAEDLLVVLQVEMGELEELLRKRGVVV
jgi:hypothetical protein